VNTTRIRYQITPLGRLLLGLSFILFFSSITSQSGLLLVPIGILIGCGLVNVFGARRVLLALELTPPELTRTIEKKPVDRCWTLTNHGDTAIGSLMVYSGDELLFGVGVIQAGETARPIPSLTFARRGVYEHESTSVRTRFPFGIVEANRRYQLTGRTIVHPDVYHVPTPQAAGFDVMVGGRFRGHRQTSSGDFFSGIREHKPGDSLRQIHWASSAKGLGLMVKTFDEELSGRVAIILDAGSSGSEQIYDNAIRLTGSMAFAALDAGHHLEFVDLNSGEHQLIPPFDDGQDLLDRLAGLKADADCLAIENLADAVSTIARKAALHLVLTQWNEAVEEYVGSLNATGRKVTIYLPFHFEAKAQARIVAANTYIEKRLLPA
jgi:uncharacterized protein (DUF58 family)